MTNADVPGRAFTQLAADQQHAPLGLFLVGLVGFLSNALTPLCASSHSPLGGVASISRTSTAQPALEPATVRTNDLDLGITISRADAEPMSRTLQVSLSTTAEESMKPGGEDVLCRRESNPTTPGTPKPCKVAAVMKNIHGGTLAPDVKSTDSKPKKRRRKEDEFASLFGSLL